MADENDNPVAEPQGEQAPLTRRGRARASLKKRATAVTSRRAAVSTPAAKPAAGKVRKPMRTVATVAIVGGLVATVALPAYAASTQLPVEEAQTLQQIAASDAQSLVVASDATATELERSSYSATTEDEIAKQKAAEAALARAKAQAAAAASLSSAPPVNVSLTAPGTGEVRWPIHNFTKGRGLGDSGYHQGVDLLAPGGTPLYAAAGGVVRLSSEGYFGYGVAVIIDHVVGGQRVSTLYGHMTYGSRQVVAGQTVAPGQLIGLVGSTGSSTANHLHFEVRINNSIVDPWAWLQANAG